MTSNENLEMEALLKTVREEAAKRKSKQSVATAIGLFIIAAVVLSLVFSIVTGGHAHVFFNPTAFIGIFVALAMVSQKQKDATKALTKYNDVRCIPAFADVLECNDRRIEVIAEEKLVELLPLMKASDVNLLNENQRKNLNHAIEKRGSTLACAIMKAYEQVGDSTAIPYVERVKQFSKEQLRRAAAEHCLPFLIERSKTEKERQTLLRAADGNTQTTEPSMLLRPAAPTEETQADTLLRPIETEETAYVTASGTTSQTEYTKNNNPNDTEQRVTLGAGQSD